MHVNTAPVPERGRAHARLLAHIEMIGALDPDRLPAAKRLAASLDAEFARKLVCALVGKGDVRAACTAA
jgi:hypothetical protein